MERHAGAYIMRHTVTPPMFIIGHRGARAVAPENTLRALEVGMACADYVEVDVRLSRDGVPVIMHDATLDRTTDGSGPICAYLLSELKVLDAGDGERVPTLQEVVSRVSGRRGLCVEVKEEGSEEIVCRVLKGYDPEKLFVVSFHKGSIEKVKILLPGVRTGFIYSRDGGDPLSTATSVRADVVLPEKDLLTSALVERAHRCGLMVVPWVLNADNEVLAAWDVGADGIVSDDPCRMSVLLTGVEKTRRREW
ncbi:glycerophosphodiester phosphodiesterase family protein [uncultured Methanofollis sp.]|uniref:glycerophosphodiester phosphodiesterase n=1 Tax=uncultured Methanofollis sp. TaxID=262500 RepID=UPI0026394862|nr:glycerophosphodiester phosphodiesterase family protein [uncultured Methanofollis sp.]